MSPGIPSIDVARRSSRVEGDGDRRATDDVHLAVDARLVQLVRERFEGGDDLLPCHRQTRWRVDRARKMPRRRKAAGDSRSSVARKALVGLRNHMRSRKRPASTAQLGGGSPSRRATCSAGAASSASLRSPTRRGSCATAARRSSRVGRMAS
jgi:hypothetical protein